ncbi:transmembrane protein 165-like isoform X1 [Biomphalaria glabrata]|uniref:GDT1 family protein n=1 Tax=Biomphalaria glabrata TaxID=6526 RepID=A0A9W3B8E4_BIOGL|nr:transmembrane protein 165-like isoform X1 [Biomphalaria glabrata]
MATRRLICGLAWVMLSILLVTLSANAKRTVPESVGAYIDQWHQDRHLLHVEDDSGSKENKGKENEHDSKGKTENDAGPLVVKKLEKDNLGLTHGFVASISVIVVSELGDKTFFIAAIMAMTHSRMTVLMGALAALYFMTILSAMVGYATTVIPRALTFYISSALFAVFGLKMLREGWYMSDDEGQEEYEEVQADLKRREDERHAQLEQEDNSIEKQNLPTQDVETGIIRSPGRRFVSGILSTVFLQALTLTFLAEWGDRSQIATIILGARENVLGVIVGSCVGHTICTGLAVIGGRFIAQRISVRTGSLNGSMKPVFKITSLQVSVELLMLHNTREQH